VAAGGEDVAKGANKYPVSGVKNKELVSFWKVDGSQAVGE
jgi:hypothetical protein